MSGILSKTPHLLASFPGQSG